MGPPRYTAVLFDLGGVLVTDIWEPLQDWLEARHGLPKPALEAFGLSVVWGDEFACRPDSHDESVLYDRLIRRFDLPTTPADLAARGATFVRPIPGMMDLVRELKGRGLTVGICSNNNEFWFARQRDALALEQEIAPPHIVLSCRVGDRKPSSGIFEAARRAVGAAYAECVFVDDRKKNVEAAAALGMTAIHLPDEIPLETKHAYLRRQLAGLRKG